MTQLIGLALLIGASMIYIIGQRALTSGNRTAERTIGTIGCIILLLIPCALVTAVPFGVHIVGCMFAGLGTDEDPDDDCGAHDPLIWPVIGFLVWLISAFYIESTASERDRYYHLRYGARGTVAAQLMIGALGFYLLTKNIADYYHDPFSHRALILGGMFVLILVLTWHVPDYDQHAAK